MIAIANIIAIYRKELQGYFESPLAYAIAAIFWLLAGFFFVALLLGPEGIIAQAAFRDGLGMTEPIDIAYEFQKLFLGVMGNLVLFIVPSLSMGLYAEERKRGTLELLATSPITNWAVALGKLLGAVTFFITMVLPLLVYESYALGAADPPVQLWVPLLGHLGLILLAASVLSIGMFISSLTESTLLAAVFTFSVILFLWVIDLVADRIGGVVGEALKHLSLVENYGNLVQGVLDTSSLILFTSYIFLGIFLTAQSIEALRFQRS